MKESFVGFKDLHWGMTGGAIASTILEKLGQTVNIYVDMQWYDESGSMVGLRKGASNYSVILTYINCGSHMLNLSIASYCSEV